MLYFTNDAPPAGTNLADCDQTKSRGLEKTIHELRDLLNRNDVVEAVDSLQGERRPAPSRVAAQL